MCVWEGMNLGKRLAFSPLKQAYPRAVVKVQGPQRPPDLPAIKETGTEDDHHDAGSTKDPRIAPLKSTCQRKASVLM